MKKIIKIMWVKIILVVSALTVVACGQQYEPPVDNDNNVEIESFISNYKIYWFSQDVSGKDYYQIKDNPSNASIFAEYSKGSESHTVKTLMNSSLDNNTDDLIYSWKNNKNILRLYISDEESSLPDNAHIKRTVNNFPYLESYEEYSVSVGMVEMDIFEGDYLKSAKPEKIKMYYKTINIIRDDFWFAENTRNTDEFLGQKDVIFPLSFKMDTTQEELLEYFLEEIYQIRLLFNISNLEQINNLDHFYKYLNTLLIFEVKSFDSSYKHEDIMNIVFKQKNKDLFSKSYNIKYVIE
ncbi:hypothetical protein NPX79_00480 [Spiroplasma endosymbiont of Anurida maritima]|uniref:hypothetical protein n=1 Tax=Spiroplasma endosymbiont of Anurida maritima TaxID=2967972 RepID=UPI0036D20D40